MSDEYQISHISDVLAVPEEKFEEFLADLRMWAEMGRPVRAMLEKAGVSPEDYRQSFVWIDDGSHDLKSIEITAHKTREELNQA